MGGWLKWSRLSRFRWYAFYFIPQKTGTTLFKGNKLLQVLKHEWNEIILCRFWRIFRELLASHMVVVLMFWPTLNLVNYTHGDIMVIVNLGMEQQIKVILWFRLCPQTPKVLFFSITLISNFIMTSLYRIDTNVSPGSSHWKDSCRCCLWKSSFHLSHLRWRTLCMG